MFPFATEVLAAPPGAGGGGTGGALMQFLPFVAIFAIFYLLVIRPQQKKAKAHRELLGSLSKGDQVVTDSGIFGTIQKLGDDSVTLEIAPKVSVRIMRGRIAEVLKGARIAEDKETESGSGGSDN
jgi:preprotein translocase subunit YajC